jgi:hypothetical protein
MNTGWPCRFCATRLQVCKSGRKCALRADATILDGASANRTYILEPSHQDSQIDSPFSTRPRYIEPVVCISMLPASDASVLCGTAVTNPAA